jgi:hypothetical protein
MTKHIPTLAEIEAEAEIKINTQSLSERILPMYHQRDIYGKLLVSNPQRAVEYFNIHARTVDKLVHPPEPPLEPMPMAKVVARFEWNRKKKEINAKPLNRRV